MNIVVSYSRLTGGIDCPSSKSDIQRRLIAAALCDRCTDIYANAFGDDVQSAVECVNALGAETRFTSFGISVSPIRTGASRVFDAGESATALRLMLPVAAALYPSARFTGRGRLPDRPISQLTDALSARGVVFSGEKLPFETRGRLNAGDFIIDGSVSSQFISGLLLAAPLLKGDSRIIIRNGLVSKAYVGMTLACMRDYGICVNETDFGYTVRGSQRYVSSGTDRAVGDWSSAAFMLAAGAIGKAGVSVRGLPEPSTQADGRILEAISAFGACAEYSNGEARAHGGDLKAADINVSDCPDLAAPVCALAALAHGESVISGVSRLRFKESDRIVTLTRMLGEMSVKARVEGDAIIITGGAKAGRVSPCADHRVLMAAAIIASGCSGDTTLGGCECVSKSYPTFFEDFRRLGGLAHVV